MKKLLQLRESPDAYRRQGGFTLIELMITVVIVAILAAVAYPSFLNQIRKSRRADAVEALARVQQAQERWRASKPLYGSLVDIGVSSNTSGGYYTIAITGTPTGTAYTATATAVSGKSQTGDTGCETLTVEMANGTLTSSPASCWSK